MTTEPFDPNDLDHVRWTAHHGGGDELADANCWRDTNAAVRGLLVVLDAANALAVHLLEKADYPPDDAELIWSLDEALAMFRGNVRADGRAQDAA